MHHHSFTVFSEGILSLVIGHPLLRKLRDSKPESQNENQNLSLKSKYDVVAKENFGLLSVENLRILQKLLFERLAYYRIDIKKEML